MSKNTNLLDCFFAVTITSVYSVYRTDGPPLVEKIAIHGKSSVPVGYILNFGNYVLVAKQGLFTANRTQADVELLDNTTPLVGLFLDRHKALEFSALPDLKIRDPRAEEDTKKVIRAIGEKHPQFIVCEGKIL